MLSPYAPEDSLDFYREYYKAQSGYGISVYTGRTVMPPGAMGGHGIGSSFAGLFKKALPMLKKVGATAGSHLLRAGGEMLDSAVNGEGASPRETLKKGARSFGDGMLQSVRSQLSTKRGAPSPKPRTGKKHPAGGVARRNNKRQRTIFD